MKGANKKTIQRGAIVPFGEIVIQDHRKAVASAVRKLKFGAVDMIVQNAVAAQFVENHSPVSGKAYRISGVSSVSARA